jgi:hypothetical protein
MSQKVSDPNQEPPVTITVRYFDVTKDYQAQLPNCLHQINARSKFAFCDECGKPAGYIFYDRVSYAIKCQKHIKETTI